MVFNNPLAQCYLSFFLGGIQPTGLRTGQTLQHMRYICPMVNQQTYYATMFDQDFGIPALAAYTVTNQNVDFGSNPRRATWRQAQGNYGLA